MRKKMALVVMASSMAILLTGCAKSSDVDMLRQASTHKFNEIESTLNMFRDKIVDLQKDFENVRVIAGIKSTPEVTSDELKFSSIKVEGIDATVEENTAVVKSNSEINVLVDVMNVSDKDLSQYICQAYITYYNGENYLNRYSLDTRFDVSPKSIRKEITFKNIPTKDSSVRHVLTIVLKDIYSNEVNTFTKEIKIS